MSSTATHKSRNGKATAIPRLLNGDHLAVPEFERRYEAMPDIKKAELIEGIVVMSPPISQIHGVAQLTVLDLFKQYERATLGVIAVANASVRFDGKNEYQPDAILRIKSGKLARSRVASDGLLDGVPELVAEIAVSSAGYDLHEKKLVYQRCLVPEYFAWQVMDSRIHLFSLEEGDYVELKPQNDGIVRSRAFPGLWLDVRSLLAGHERKSLRALEKGLKSAEHAAFVKKLAAK